MIESKLVKGASKTISIAESDFVESNLTESATLAVTVNSKESIFSLKKNVLGHPPLIE